MYRRSLPLSLIASLGIIIACGSDDDSTLGPNNGADGGKPCEGFGCTDTDGGKPGCVGLACKQVDTCEAGTSTTLTGRVFDPAGKVPLYNVVVYVPNGQPNPITSGLGATCDRCDGNISGNPIAITSTNASGDFTLTNIPADIDFTIVIQIGKWRRTIPISKVAPCQTIAVDNQLTRLPRNRTEGDIPRIALTTGSADPLECLLRKIGLDDSEFGLAGSESRIHLFTGSSTAPNTATSSFAAGGTFGEASAFWSNLEEMKKYDLVLLSCEGGEKAATKPEAARQALYDYAKLGGRVFTSHYHHYWFSNSPLPEVRGLASWTNDYSCTTGTCPPIVDEPAPNITVNATLNTSFAKGTAMKEWLKNTQSLNPDDTLPILEARHNVDAVNPGALSWMTIQNPAAANRTAHEYISFNTPVGAADDAVCGRVVYSDLHVGAGDTTGAPFPNGCITTDLTPQQKALEFMLFDLSSCIQKDDKPPVVPK